jgi:hypothetical protein
MTDAINALLEERGKQYGDAVEQYARVAQVWSGIIGHEVTALQAALCMVGLKVVRAEMAPDHQDSFDDAQGYVRLSEKIAAPTPTHVVGVHNHPPYRPVCNERITPEGVRRGACLNDDGSPR